MAGQLGHGAAPGPGQHPVPQPSLATDSVGLLESTEKHRGVRAVGEREHGQLSAAELRQQGDQGKLTRAAGAGEDDQSAVADTVASWTRSPGD